MEKITITKITRNQRTSKAGKPFTSLGLKTQEYGDQWLNGFGNKDNQNWKEGDTVEVEINKVNKDGKEYLNFEIQKKDNAIMVELGKIRMTIGALRNDILDIKEHLHLKAKELHYPTPEEEGIDVDDTFPEEDIEEEMHSAPR